MQEKAAKLKATGGEVSRLDATVITLDDSSIVNACDELKAFIDEKGAEEIKNNEIMQQVRHTQLQLNITPDYKFYICLVAIFGPQRNIVKHWDTFEAIFTSMAEQDEENGNKHLFQAIIQFFINKYPDQQKYAMAFCKKLWDNSIFDDEFFIKWHSRKLKLDKDSGLNDKSAEKAMRELITPFVVDWLQTAEYDDETGYGEEEDA